MCIRSCWYQSYWCSCFPFLLEFSHKFWVCPVDILFWLPTVLPGHCAHLRGYVVRLVSECPLPFFLGGSLGNLSPLCGFLGGCLGPLASSTLSIGPLPGVFGDCFSSLPSFFGGCLSPLSSGALLFVNGWSVLNLLSLPFVLVCLIGTIRVARGTGWAIGRVARS